MSLLWEVRLGVLCEGEERRWETERRRERKREERGRVMKDRERKGRVLTSRYSMISWESRNNLMKFGSTPWNSYNAKCKNTSIPIKKTLKDACVCLNCRYIAPRGLDMYTTPHIFVDLDTEVNLRACLQLHLDIMYTANSASTCMQLQTGRHHWLLLTHETVSVLSPIDIQEFHLRLNVAEGDVHYVLLQSLKVHLPSNPVHINWGYIKGEDTW